MENNNLPPNGGFIVNVNSPGNQIIQTQNNNYYGPVYQGKASADQVGFTDEHIKKALLAIIGKDKVIDCKWKWAGAYWYLRWECKYPVDPQKFCEKINSLGLILEDKYRCEYDNIRRICLLSFMDYDPKKMDEVKYSRNDKDVFMACREIALKLAEELGKVYLSK